MIEKLVETERVKIELEELEHPGEDKHLLELKIQNQSDGELVLDLKAILENLILIGTDNVNQTSVHHVKSVYDLQPDAEREFKILTEEKGLKHALNLSGELQKGSSFSAKAEI